MVSFSIHEYWFGALQYIEDIKNVEDVKKVAQDIL